MGDFEKYKERLRKWRRANPEKAKKYYAEHPEYYRKYQKHYKKDHKEQVYIEKLERYKRTQDAENSKCKWSEEEIDLIMKHELTDTELSKLLGRSVESIQVKRSRVKRCKL